MEQSFSFQVQEEQQLSINTFGHEVTEPCHKYGPAVRPYYLIHYILKGRGRFEVNGREYMLSAGKGFLIEPDYLTEYTADQEDPWTYVWLGFSGKDAGRIVSELGLSQEQPIFTCREGEAIEACIWEMIRHNHSSKADTFYILSMAYLFFSILAASGWEDAVQKDSNQYVSQAIAYIRNHIAEPLQADTVAEYVGLNRSYLSTLFRKHTGLSPLQYIQRMRLTKARHLLEATGLSISAIAYSCGYQQPESLNRIFRREYGLSPGAYRRMIRGREGA